MPEEIIVAASSSSSDNMHILEPQYPDATEEMVYLRDEGTSEATVTKKHGSRYASEGFNGASSLYLSGVCSDMDKQSDTMQRQTLVWDDDSTDNIVVNCSKAYHDTSNNDAYIHTNIDLTNLFHKRKPSLTSVEQFVLHALLIEDKNVSAPGDNSGVVAKSTETSTSDYNSKSSTVPVVEPCVESKSPQQKQQEQDDEEDEQQMAKRKLHKQQKQHKELNDEILFTIPFLERSATNPTHPSPIQTTNRNGQQENEQQHNHRRNIVGLWKSHEKGIHPKQLIRRQKSIVCAAAAAAAAAATSASNASTSTNTSTNANVNETVERSSSSTIPLSKMQTKASLLESFQSFASTENVRHGKHNKSSQGKDSSVHDFDNGSYSESSSIGEDDHAETYDTWDVLRDEYSSDFGFSYGFSATDTPQISHEDQHRTNLRNNNIGSAPGHISDEYYDFRDGYGDSIDNDDSNTFKILGTTADDPSVQPHVLSPPLMDAIMSFVPDSLQSQNYWLKYSLIRDGSSLDTMKHYIRASAYTVIAIETTTGEVFGSFTSSPWVNNPTGFYGTSPAFVWKMRYNRRTTRCSSLFEQAQLESVIDVYMPTDKSQRIQVCRSSGIAVGGDESMMPTTIDDTVSDPEAYHGSISDDFISSFTERSGFAIALMDDNLNRGTTSRSGIFKSPSLVGTGTRTEIYHIAGLEVWTFTPCFDVPSAERLEMTKYFVEHQQNAASTFALLSRNNSVATSTSSPSPKPSSVSLKSISSINHSITNNNNRNKDNNDNSTRAMLAYHGGSQSSQDVFQKQQQQQQQQQQQRVHLFYKKIGDDPESESRRELNQYQDTAQSRNGTTPKVLGHSPKYPL